MFNITDEYPRPIENPIGMKVVGYLPDGRPIIENMDGTFSSDGMIIVQIEPDVWMPMPTMFRGKYVTPDHAIQILKRFNWTDPDTGEVLPRFDTREAAEASAQERAIRITEEAKRMKEGIALDSADKPPADRIMGMVEGGPSPESNT